MGSKTFQTETNLVNKIMFFKDMNRKSLQIFYVESVGVDRKVKLASKKCFLQSDVKKLLVVEKNGLRSIWG